MAGKRTVLGQNLEKQKTDVFKGSVNAVKYDSGIIIAPPEDVVPATAEVKYTSYRFYIKLDKRPDRPQPRTIGPIPLNRPIEELSAFAYPDEYIGRRVLIKYIGLYHNAAVAELVFIKQTKAQENEEAQAAIQLAVKGTAFAGPTPI